MNRDDGERSDLDTGDEPEPDWADAIRRGRKERAERLRRLLGDEPATEPEERPRP